MKLSQGQLESLLENTSIDQKGENIYAKCPQCAHMEFGISLKEDHPFNCFRGKCGFRGTIFTLLKHLGRMPEFAGKREIDIFGKLESFDKPGEVLPPLEIIEPPPLWKRVYDDTYLRERGFTDDQFEKFEVGRSRLHRDYVTFLIRQEGALVGTVSRSEKSKKWIDEYNKKQKEAGTNLVYLRYRNSTTDFNRILFGIDEVITDVTTDVILVEGIFSKTKTDLNLQLDSQDGIKCCCTFGAKFSPTQKDLLKDKGVKNIWIWFEADVLQKVKEVATYASLFFNVRVSYISGKDPNDLSADEAFELLENAKDFLDFNTSYIK